MPTEYVVNLLIFFLINLIDENSDLSVVFNLYCEQYEHPFKCLRALYSLNCCVVHFSFELFIFFFSIFKRSLKKKELVLRLWYKLQCLSDFACGGFFCCAAVFFCFYELGFCSFLRLWTFELQLESSSPRQLQRQSPVFYSSTAEILLFVFESSMLLLSYSCDVFICGVLGFTFA